MTEKYLDIDGLQTFWSDICDEIEDNAYTLPVATESTLGGVKEGDGVDVDANGVLSLGNLTHSGSGESVVTHGCALYSVDAEGWAEQDGTPTPENPVEIKVARGRNLFDGVIESGAIYPDTGQDTPQADRYRSKNYTPVEAGSDYCISVDGTATSVNLIYYDATKSYVGFENKSVFTPPTGAFFVRFYSNDKINNDKVQLELGSTPTPYVPYGHVGLEVTHDGTTTVTPIPLPSKGWAGALPDGTADTLAVDSAGRYEWVNATDECDLGSRSYTIEDSTIGRVRFSATDSPDLNMKFSDVAKPLLCTMFKAATTIYSSQIADGEIGITNSQSLPFVRAVSTSLAGKTAAEVAQMLSGEILLYPLATPTTEHGYIDLPTFTDGCTVSIPELGEIGVAWFVSGAAELVEHATNERKRVEDALADVYEAIADL